MPRVTDEHDSLCQHPTELAQHLDTGSSRQGNDCKGLWGGGKGGPLCSRLEAGGSRGAAPPTRGVPRGCGTVGVGERESRSRHGPGLPGACMGRRPLILASSVRHRPRAPPTDACAAGCLRGATPRGRVCAHASVCVQPPGGACSLAHPVSLRAPNPSAQRRAPTPRATPQRHAPTRGATACRAAAPPPPPPCPAPRARAGRCRSLPAAAFWRAERQGRAGPAMSRPEPPPPAEPGAAIERLCQELNLDAASAAEALRDFTALRGTYSLEVRGPWPGPWPWRGGARRAAAPGGGRGEGARPRPGRPPPAASAARPRVRPPASACVHGRGGAAPGPAGGPGPPPPPAARRFPCPGRARRCTGWPAPSTSPAARAWCPPWGAA